MQWGESCRFELIVHSILIFASLSNKILYSRADNYISKFFTGTTTRADIESCEASSEYSSSYVCNNVYDDNTNSYWATRSEGIGFWIQVGLFVYPTASNNVAFTGMTGM